MAQADNCDALVIGAGPCRADGGRGHGPRRAPCYRLRSQTLARAQVPDGREIGAEPAECGPPARPGRNLCRSRRPAGPDAACFRPGPDQRLGRGVGPTAVHRVIRARLSARHESLAALAGMAGAADRHGRDLHRGWRWTGGAFDFATPDGPRHLAPRVTVLAMGGASWPRLGSDGGWRAHLATRDIACTPFQPANMGFSVAWSDHMPAHFGQPVKGARLGAGGQTLRAEFVLSARGVEGGGIYALSRPLRDGAGLTLDLFPDLDAATLDARLARRPAKGKPRQPPAQGAGADRRAACAGERALPPARWPDPESPAAAAGRAPPDGRGDLDRGRHCACRA